MGWFGNLSTNVAVKVGLDNAAFVSQSVPSQMTPGQTYPVSVTMHNSGSTTWAAGTVGLGSQNTQDNTTWGFNRVWLASAVAPGSDATFNFTVTAASTVGTYNFQWRMVEGSLGWFGATTPNVVVGDGVDDAAFVSQSVPSTMTPGQTYPVTITMQNNGATTWPAGTSYQLGSQNPGDNTVWGLSRVSLPSSVAPSSSVTLTFNAVAPAAAGAYNFQWRMLQGTNGWFGAPSANTKVTVGSFDASLFFVQTDNLDTPRLIADANQATVWKWDNQEPFGNDTPNGDPGNTGSTFDFALRFPGQYADRENGTNYNNFRDYDALIGRYLQSDPATAMLNPQLYAYVNLNPLLYRDPLGLIKDSITSTIESAIARGDIKALQGLVEAGGLSEQQEAAVQAGIRAIEILNRSTKDLSQIAKAVGRSKKVVRKAIEACKQDNLPKSSSVKNPDVYFDPETGELYPETPSGGIGDSIGNIGHYLE